MRDALARLDFRHPASLVATMGGIGLLPVAPGTWASALALPLAWWLHGLGGGMLLGAAFLALAGIGWWASEVYVAATGRDDPPEVVVDEVAAQWLTLLAVPPDLLLYAAGFALFRLFDIWKPWPISWADANLSGGLGVMADDLLAGAFAGAVLTIIALLLEMT